MWDKEILTTNLTILTYEKNFGVSLVEVGGHALNKHSNRDIAATISTRPSVWSCLQRDWFSRSHSTENGASQQPVWQGMDKEMTGSTGHPVTRLFFPFPFPYLMLVFLRGSFVGTSVPRLWFYRVLCSFPLFRLVGIHSRALRFVGFKLLFDFNCGFGRIGGNRERFCTFL